jgi:hypothetical protein
VTHLCPARGCPREVPDHLLMCGIDWRLVPAPLQRAVYAAYDDGRGVGTLALFEAQRAAIEYVNRERTP